VKGEPPDAEWDLNWFRVLCIECFRARRFRDLKCLTEMRLQFERRSKKALAREEETYIDVRGPRTLERRSKP